MTPQGWPPADAKLPAMRIASWNVNDLRKRLPLLLAWLEATGPDIVALQELKITEGEFPRAELERAGYGCLVVGQRTDRELRGVDEASDHAPVWAELS